MKKILLQLLLLFPILAASAQKTVTVDSSYITNVAGIFFEVKVVQYSNGEGQTTTTVLGDTATVIQRYQSSIRSQAQGMANDIKSVYRFNRRVTELIRQGNEVQTRFGTNPVRLIQNQVASDLTDNSWVVLTDTTRNVTFTVNAQGQLRYQVQGFTTRNATTLGDVIVLRNFQNTGTDVTLYRDSERGQWYTNATNTVVLRVPGSSVRNAPPPPEDWMERTATPPPAEVQPSTSEPAKDKPKRKRKKD